jgi:hypothetical protein
MFREEPILQFGPIEGNRRRCGATGLWSMTESAALYSLRGIAGRFRTTGTIAFPDTPKFSPPGPSAGNTGAGARRPSRGHRCSEAGATSVRTRLVKLAFSSQKRGNAKKCEKMRRFSSYTGCRTDHNYLQNLGLQKNWPSLELGSGQASRCGSKYGKIKSLHKNTRAARCEKMRKKCARM